MRFSRSIILFLLFVSVACTQEKSNVFLTTIIATKTLTIVEDSLDLRHQEGLVYYQNIPFTGRSISYYNNGKEATRIAYSKGEKHGLYKKRFEDGLLSFESNYYNGKRNGKTYSWWRNGNLRSESNYENGIPNGIQKQWYGNGAKFKQINLTQGKEQGLQQSWRENGKLYNNYEAKNGRIFGLKRSNLCYELDNENIQYAED